MVLLPRPSTGRLNSVLVAVGLGTLFPCWLSVRGCVQALRASFLDSWPLHVQSQQQQAKSHTQNLSDIIPS